MRRFDFVVNSYIALVACAIGFSVSGYIVKGSSPSIPLYIILLGLGVAIFSGLNASIKANAVDGGVVSDKAKDMGRVVNIYVATVAYGIGFSVSGYILEGSFPGIPLFIILLGSGVTIFSRFNVATKNDDADSGFSPVAGWALAIGGMAIGWDVGQALWSNG
jgi:hypothetical protein